MDVVTKLKAYAAENQPRLLDELIAFLAQPSVSTTGLGIDETVKMLMKELARRGFEVKVLELPGAYPIVFGEGGDPEAKRSLTIYGHYDVQDPDPLDEWDSDPFKPVIRDGKIYARGATDDKGNLWANIKAAEAFLALKNRPPIKIKFFFEGEEEIGSPNLRGFMRKYADILRSEATILCDRGVHESGRPQIYLGDKGLISVRLGCRRVGRDVHSGHAPLIPSSIWDLVRLLDSIKDEKGRIRIPDYYGQVDPPTQEELALLKSIPFDPDQFRERYGIAAALVEDKPAKMLQALVFQPTANISGIKSGWMGEKPKTIVPAQAQAYMDFRLVKSMRAAEAGEMINNFIEKSPFGPFEYSVKTHFEEYRCPPSDPWAQLAIQCAREATGEEPVVWPLLDGSGPLCWFHEYLGSPTFIIGLGSPFETARTHSPNENIGVDNYLTGIVQMATMLYRGAQMEL